MNFKSRLHELSDRSVEFARGDFAIPALKKILVGSQGMPVGEFNKVSPIFKGKFPKAAYRTGLFPSKTASSATRSEVLEAIAPIRKWGADQIRGDRMAKREFARGDFLRQAVGKYSDVAPAVVPGVSPSVVGPRGKEWRSQFLLWARKRAAKQMV
jgi:hypothetical protein